MELTLEARTEAAAVELLERLDKRRLDWAQNTAIVGVFEAEDSKPYFSSTQVCHAGLSSMGKCKRVISALMSGEGYATGRVLDKEVEVWFVDYILNRSAYAETFITKDAEKALEQRYTISTGDVPANLMAAGMVALRRLWEYTYVAKAAYDLAKEGVNEDLAFLLGHLLQADVNPNDDNNANWKGCAAGHCSINPVWMNWGSVRNFINHKLVIANEWYSKGGSYRGYDNMYGMPGGESYYSFVHDNFPYDKCKGEVSVSLNPFTAALPKKVGGHQVPYGKAIKVMAEWAKTTLTEKINA